MDADLPVIEDPDSYGYYRPEGDGMLVGLFEPVGAPWSLDGVPRDFAFGKLPPDWERMEPYLARAMERIPSLADTGVRTFFCGPESFTSDVRPLLGPAPELDGYFVAAGLNSLGILSGGGVGDHDRALDRRRGAAGGRDRGRHRPDRDLRDVEEVPLRAHRRAARRPVRRRRLAVLEAQDRRATSAAPCCTTGWSRPAPTSASRRAGSSPSGSPGRASTRSPRWTTAARPATRSSSASTARSARPSA